MTALLAKNLKPSVLGSEPNDVLVLKNRKRHPKRLALDYVRSKQVPARSQNHAQKYYMGDWFYLE